jgi:TFIIF-interacting CTD phosphatase-like protein
MNAVSAWYYTDPYYQYTYQYALRAQYGTKLNQTMANTQTQDISIYDNNNNNNNIINSSTNDDSNMKQLVSYKNSMDISFNAWKLRYKILEELFNKYADNSTRYFRLF